MSFLLCEDLDPQQNNKQCLNVLLRIKKIMYSILIIYKHLLFP